MACHLPYLISYNKVTAYGHKQFQSWKPDIVWKFDHIETSTDSYSFQILYNSSDAKFDIGTDNLFRDFAEGAATAVFRQTNLKEEDTSGVKLLQQNVIGWL